MAPDCIDSFCNCGKAGKDLQIHIDQVHPDFFCEGSRCSEHSPGPVSDEETLAFILINPLHYDEKNGVVVPEAFQELTNRDLSTIRICCASVKELDATKSQLIAIGQAKIPQQLREVDEVCLAKVSKIRSETHNGRRIFGVYDTALVDNKAHSSIFTRQIYLDDRVLRKIVRSRIHGIFAKERVKFSDCRKLLGSR